jgi:hypothetical protein
MKERLVEIDQEITVLKRQLYNLWAKNGKIDQEVLNLADKIDHLINEYDYLRVY